MVNQKKIMYQKKELLKKMATTKEQEDILKRIEDETIPSVKDAWIDYFLKITKRSQCKSDLLKK